MRREQPADGAADAVGLHAPRAGRVHPVLEVLQRQVVNHACGEPSLVEGGFQPGQIFHIADLRRSDSSGSLPLAYLLRHRRSPRALVMSASGGVIADAAGRSPVLRSRRYCTPEEWITS